MAYGERPPTGRPRIKRDHPEIAERMTRGEFSSVRQAAQNGIEKKATSGKVDGGKKPQSTSAKARDRAAERRIFGSNGTKDRPGLGLGQRGPEAFADLIERGA